MKSLNFNKLNLQREDFLSKTQMKKIMGGYGDCGVIECLTDSDCGDMSYCIDKPDGCGSYCRTPGGIRP